MLRPLRAQGAWSGRAPTELVVSYGNTLTQGRAGGFHDVANSE